MGWVCTGDARSHPFALAEAERTVRDIRDLAQNTGLGLSLTGAILTVFETAIAQGLHESNLPELPRAIAAREGLTLRPID